MTADEAVTVSGVSEDPGTNLYPADLVYQDCRRILCDVVWKHVRTYGGNWEDLFCEANYQFLIALQKYQPRKGPFTAWVRFRVAHQLLERARNAAKFRARHRRVDVPPESLPDRGEKQSPLAGLGGDALELWEVLVGAPPTPEGRDEAVEETLVRGRRWGSARLKRAFGELARCAT